nr:DUF257 family protein [Thermococcus pacificus]
MRGEDVIIEYHSDEPVHILLLELLRETERKGGAVIIDELDQLHVFRVHLELSGLKTSPIDHSPVIKMGGIIDTGNVIGKIDMSKEPAVRKRYYEELLQKTGNPPFRVIVGFDKVLLRYENDPKEREKIFGHMVRPHIGSSERVAIYIVNRDLVNETTIKELREHATRVLKSEFNGEGFTLRVVKSIFPGEYGWTVSVPIKGNE